MPHESQQRKRWALRIAAWGEILTAGMPLCDSLIGLALLGIFGEGFVTGKLYRPRTT